MGTFDTFPHVVIFQFPIFPPPSHVPFSWLGVKAGDLVKGSLRNERKKWRHCHIAPRACSADLESLPEAFGGKGKGETTMGTRAFGGCVQRRAM